MKFKNFFSCKNICVKDEYDDDDDDLIKNKFKTFRVLPFRIIIFKIFEFLKRKYFEITITNKKYIYYLFNEDKYKHLSDKEYDKIPLRKEIKNIIRFIFGYFKLDKMRKSFIIFPNLLFTSNFNNSSRKDIPRIIPKYFKSLELVSFSLSLDDLLKLLTYKNINSLKLKRCYDNNTPLWDEFDKMIRGKEIENKKFKKVKNIINKAKRKYINIFSNRRKQYTTKSITYSFEIIF